MYKLIGFILLTVLTVNLAADFDEREIYLKQASQLTLRRQYDKANEVYLRLLADYPGDAEIVLKLVTNYITLNKLPEAEILLAENRQVLPALDYTQQMIIILLAQAEMKKAETLAKDFLRANPGQVNAYRTIGSAFERYRQYEQATAFYLQARQVTQDDYLFTRELANGYENMKSFALAIPEYLKHLERNKAYFHYVLNRIKIMLEEDSNQILVLRKFSSTSQDPQVQEILALALAEIGNYEESLLEFTKLPPEKTLDFAETLTFQENFEYALNAYHNYLERETTPNLKADALIEIAEIHLIRNEFDTAENILQQLRNDQSLQDRKYRYKTRANRYCRELLATLAQYRGQPLAIVIDYLNEAKEFANNAREKQEIDFKIVHLQTMNENFQEARSLLTEVLKNEEKSTEIFKQGYFYAFLLALMQNDPQADSLLSELLINLPESPYTNDALNLAVTAGSLQENHKTAFLAAYRQNQLLKCKEAVAQLEQLHEETGNEEFLIIAADWAARCELSAKAWELFSREYSSEDLSQYAALNQVKLTSEQESRYVLITEFLKTWPHSVFAPAFRTMLRK
ncbi:MAG: hypothetical protein JW784_04555 [Candidatus Cloacimonetes bacterium]|nr:hypothetical protein [Candidatus Cloacimonadota bacterium]